MEYDNPLDHLIHRFQHRWETNAQFRAAMSGVLGLALIVFLCVGVAGVNAAATNVLSAVGFGGAGGRDQGNLDPGGQFVNGNWVFYTPTVPDWKSGGTPGSNPIPNSQTPQPSPTPTATPPDAATATPCKLNCGGGGGVTITAACVPTPCQWYRGQPATLTFHTSKPNNPINMFIHWSNGADWLSAGGQYGAPESTDGLGNATWTFTVPTSPTTMCGTSPPVKVDYSTKSGGGSAYGPSLSVPCS
jgi:hypothetical protein